MTSPAPKRTQRSGGQKKPFKIYEIKSLIARFVQEKRWRDLAMFTTGIDTMLRASDLLNLRVHDVLNETTGQMKQSFSVLQTKTRRTESPTQNPKPPKAVVVELSPPCQTALLKCVLGRYSFALAESVANGELRPLHQEKWDEDA